MQAIIRILYCGVLISFGILLSAQEKTRSEGFGSADQVERQLEEDEQKKHPIWELGFLQFYFDAKGKLKDKTGLGLGLDYSSVYFNANNSMGESTTGSGMVRFYGSWEIIGKGRDNTGAFIFKVEHRHKYTVVAPNEFAFQSGYAGMLVPPFGNDEFRMSNFYWRQRVAGGRFSLIIGLLDATDYLDVYGLASPWSHFMNFQFITGSETMFLPNDVNLGVAVAGYISDNIYVMAGINDANSNPKVPFSSLETFFSKSQYFKSVEVGWVSTRERYFFDNIHVLYWHCDGSDLQATPEGWGINLSGSWFFQDKYMPFVRGGYAENGGTILQHSVTAGFGWHHSVKNNVLGAAMCWGELNENTWGSGLDNQISMEIFYRLQLSGKLAVTPDVQYILNPALSTDNSLFLWGIRGRLAL